MTVLERFSLLNDLCKEANNKHANSFEDIKDERIVENKIKSNEIFLPKKGRKRYWKYTLN